MLSGTEIGGGYVSSTLVHPNAPSTFTTPTLGAHLVLLPDGSSDAATDPSSSSSSKGSSSSAVCVAGHAAGEGPGPVAWCAGGGGGSGGMSGEVALVPPMLGMSQRLLNKDHGQVRPLSAPPENVFPHV